MIKSAALHAAQALGYTQLKQKQAEVVEHFLSGQDVFAVLPTGYGGRVLVSRSQTLYLTATLGKGLGTLVYPLHLQMVVILQPASRRPVSMLTIFTVVIMNNCQQDAKSSYFLPF